MQFDSVSIYPFETCKRKYMIMCSFSEKNILNFCLLILYESCNCRRTTAENNCLYNHNGYQLAFDMWFCHFWTRCMQDKGISSARS